jgi:hypothetical protein
MKHCDMTGLLFAEPGVVGWKQTIRRTIAKFAVLLLVSSIALPGAAFRGSHGTGRGHSRSSSHRVGVGAQ